MPLWESCIAIRVGPQKKNKKGQFGISLLQDCRLSTALKYFESPPSTQNCDRYSRQCNEHFIRGDQNFWFIHHNGGSLFFFVQDQWLYFLSHYALLENHYERSLLLNIQHKNRSQSMLVLCWIDSHIRKLPNDWLFEIGLYFVHCKPLITDHVMYAYGLFSCNARNLQTSIWRPRVCI